MKFDFTNKTFKQLKLILLSTLTLLIISSSAWATTYYVDATSGSDSSSGTSQESAWKTLGKVNSITFKPGDVIRFKRGEVWRENVTLRVNYSGTSSNWIVFSDYGTGNLPKFDFSNNGGEGFYIYYQDYIKIENIHIYNAYREGLAVYGSSSDHMQGFQLAGCYIEANGLRRSGSDFGIDARYVDNLIITDTVFDGNQQSGTRIQSCRNVIIGRCEAKNHSGGDDHDGFLIQNTDGLEMYDIRAHHNSESGIDLGGYETFVMDMANANLYRCMVYDNGDDGIAVSGCEINDSSPFYTHSINFYNCASYDNGTFNLKIYQNAYRISFYNCLFDGSGSHNLKVDAGPHDITFRNCIVSNSSGDPINIWTDSVYPRPYNLDFDYMIWYPKVPESAYRGATYMTSDPGFVNRSGDDYSLQSNSSAIDAGKALEDKYKEGLDPAYSMQNVKTLDQNLNGQGWEIGPYVFPTQQSEIDLLPPLNLRVVK